jgi:hypothetical protein
MKLFTTTALPLLLLASQFATAQEQPLTRAEVKKETLEAICRGDETAPGDSGMTMRQLFPEDYKGREAHCQMTEKSMAAMREATRLRQQKGLSQPSTTK